MKIFKHKRGSKSFFNDKAINGFLPSHTLSHSIIHQASDAKEYDVNEYNVTLLYLIMSSHSSIIEKPSGC